MVLFESLGMECDSVRSAEWLFNQTGKLELESFNGSVCVSKIEHDLILEDKVCIVDPRGTKFDGTVTEISNATTFVVSWNGNATLHLLISDYPIYHL